MRISDWSSDVCSSDLQAMGALHAVYAAERARHADRAALVAADGHLDLAGTDQRAAARRRAAGRLAHLPRIMHRTGDRKIVVEGKIVSVRVDLGGRRILKKKHKLIMIIHNKTTN